MTGSYVWWFASWRAEIYMVMAYFLEGLGFEALGTRTRGKEDRKAL